MLPSAQSYDELVARFAWDLPQFYNIGVDICDRWATMEPGRTALLDVSDAALPANEITFGALASGSNRLANALRSHGLERGDRVAILLPQTPETLIAHIAAFKLGAISIPLTVLFGVDALRHRLADSGARVIFTDPSCLDRLAEIALDLPDLKTVVCLEMPPDVQIGGQSVVDFDSLLASASPAFEPVRTRADDPALIIYTSGTTGAPKGALHAHRTLLGHLPGMEMSHDLFPQPGDRMWSPADWAWIGGLINVLFPALHHGVPVVAHRMAKFNAERAFALIRDVEIRNAFIPPTALKLMRQVPDAKSRFSPKMRTIGSGGESLGPELLAWGREVFGLTINEFYGQTECNLVVSSCSAIMDARPGAMGRPVAGHEVAVLRPDGTRAMAGEQGPIAVRAPDPVMFLGYWKNAEATEQKFQGDWLLTGDTGVCDADGWLSFVGRDDDVITSSGYRMGAVEIEDCLMTHPAVAMSGVIGKPDPERTQIIKAFIVLTPDATPTDALKIEIKDHVRTRLAAHEYPREITFVEALPMTTTGKIRRRDLRAWADREDK